MSKPEFRRCRALTVHGRQCHQRALRGESLCVAHSRNCHPVCPPKDGKVDMPLLEDVSAIQYVASQVAHGLFTETIDPWRAGKILYACQVAAMTVPRPAPVKTEPVEDHGPVTETFKDLNGEILGPEEPWVGVRGAFEPVWSHDKWLYELECERLGQPKPKSPADMPPQGWLTPDEQQQQGYSYPNPWKMKTLERRVEEDQRGNLPPLNERKCSYDNPHCVGPATKTQSWRQRCPYCEREREAHQRIARGEDPAPALDPKARFGEVEPDSSAAWPSRQSPAPNPTGFIDEPEETEDLNPYKVTLLGTRKIMDECGTLPGLEERTCAYEMPDCQGPGNPTCCTYCRREADNYRKLRRQKNDLDLNASAALNLQSGFERVRLQCCFERAGLQCCFERAGLQCCFKRAGLQCCFERAGLQCCFERAGLQCLKGQVSNVVLKGHDFSRAEKAARGKGL